MTVKTLIEKRSYESFLHRTWIDLKLYANNKREKKYEQNKSFCYSK